MNRNQEIKHWRTIINEVVRDYRRLERACEAAIKAGTMDIDGPLHEAIWKAFQGMLERIDSHSCWIAWFIWDNDCGKKGYEARLPGDKEPRRITATHQLATLIVDDKNSHKMT